VRTNLFVAVETNHSVATVFNVLLFDAEHVEPGWALGQGNGQLARGEIDARHGDCLRRISNKHISSKAVVHKIPEKEKSMPSFVTSQHIEVAKHFFIRQLIIAKKHCGSVIGRSLITDLKPFCGSFLKKKT
jgi:hypothetical protein